LDFANRDVGKLILGQLGMDDSKLDMSEWKKLYHNIKSSSEIVNIAMVGKYV